MQHFPLHKALELLAWLKGTWRTLNDGSGKYPTIKDFKYYEEISFESIGQPMFNYTAQSWHQLEGGLKKPLHRETGFLKVIPETNKVSLILAHNFGLTTIEQGEVNDKIICLKCTDISRMDGTKSPSVTQTSREFKFDGDHLEQVFYMGTSKTPQITEHLRAKYVKVSEEE